MTVDTATQPSSASLSVSDAAALFDAPPKEPEQAAQPEAKAEEPAKVEPGKVPEATQAETDDQPVDEATDSDETITIEVDGKAVEIKKSELPDLYKGNLRQADYTRKTMEAAEQRKAAEAETAKARDERKQYAENLSRAEALFLAQEKEFEQVAEQLLESNPQEYLKQKRISDQRQAYLRQIPGERQRIAAIDRAEAKKNLLDHLTKENQAVLDKLPEWKDEKKAAAEKTAIANELVDRGFDPRMIFGERDEDGAPKPENPGLSDHRILLMARDAMLYRQMMEKAKAAAKKVSQLPQKVEKPGVATNPTDGRTVAMKRLNASGSIHDAAKALEGFFK